MTTVTGIEAAQPVVDVDGVLADAAAVVDGVDPSALLADPFMGPGGDPEAARQRMRELNAGIAELALVTRAAAPPKEVKEPTLAEKAAASVRLEGRRGEVAYLLGVCGLTDMTPGLNTNSIASHAESLGIGNRVAVYSAAMRAGIIIEGLFGRR